MFKFASSCLLPLCLMLSCMSPGDTPTRKSFQPIGDPFLTPDAPRLVFLKEIKIERQPSAWGSYPKTAQDKGVQGDVLVEIWIDATGTPTKAGALWGPDELRQAAVDYVLRWKFRPYFYEGVPQACRFRMAMPFRLRVGGEYQRLPPDLVY